MRWRARETKRREGNIDKGEECVCMSPYRTKWAASREPPLPPPPATVSLKRRGTETHVGKSSIFKRSESSEPHASGKDTFNPVLICKYK